MAAKPLIRAPKPAMAVPIAAIATHAFEPLEPPVATVMYRVAVGPGDGCALTVTVAEAAGRAVAVTVTLTVGTDA